MDLDTFRVRFKTFKATLDDVVNLALDAAALEVNADAWGDSYDEAHGLTAADKLWSDPRGSSLRQEGTDVKESPYAKQLADMRRRLIVPMTVL